MRPLDAEKQIKELAGKLNIELFLSKLREYERGDHRTASMSDGRGSAESACPVATTPATEDWLPNRGMPKGRVLGTSDPTDRQIRSDRLRVEQALRHVALGLQEISQIANAWCIPRTDDTEKEKQLAEEGPKGSGPCTNVWCPTVCSGIGNDRLRHGRCRPCYRVWKLEGRDRDPRRVDQLTNPDSAA